MCCVCHGHAEWSSSLRTPLQLATVVLPYAVLIGMYSAGFSAPDCVVPFITGAEGKVMIVYIIVTVVLLMESKEGLIAD